MSHKTPEEIVEALGDIYETKFGGKRRGRFQIPRALLKQIAGRKKLHNSLLEAVIQEAYERGYAVIDREEMISVIELSILEGHRKVPVKVAQEFMEEVEATDEESEGTEDDEIDGDDD